MNRTSDFQVSGERRSDPSGLNRNFRRTVDRAVAYCQVVTINAVEAYNRWGDLAGLLVIALSLVLPRQARQTHKVHDLGPLAAAAPSERRPTPSAATRGPVVSIQLES
jgi:hypothetical protein